VQAAVDDVADAYRKPVTEAGIPAVMWPPAGQPAPDSDAGQEPPARSEKQQADDELFFLRMLKPFLTYVPEVEALRSCSTRVVTGGGRSPRTRSPHVPRWPWPSDSVHRRSRSPAIMPASWPIREGFAAAVRRVLAQAD